VSTLAIAHVTEREQFGAPLADLELVQEKIGWMVSYLFGVESMCYLTTGLDVNMSYAANLENATQPDAEKIKAAVKKVLYRE